VDVTGAYYQDTALQYPKPSEITFSYFTIHTVSYFPRSNSTSDLIHHFYKATKVIQNMMLNEISQRNLWRDPLFPAVHLTPLLGELLDTRNLIDDFSGSPNGFEVFRSATLLYVSALRARFGIDTMTGDNVYSTKIQRLVSIQDSQNGLSVQFQVWILCVAYTSCSCSHYQKPWFENLLKHKFQVISINGPEKLLEMLEEMIWDKILLKKQTTELIAMFLNNEELDYVRN
jgi:hypothetical protein